MILLPNWPSSAAKILDGPIVEYQIHPRQIGQITDEVLEGWIEYMRDALEGGDKALARRIIQQFVAKIVIKEGTGTLYYTFPFPDDLYMPSYGNLDLKGFEPLTSTVRL